MEELRRGAALVALTGGPGSLPVPRRDDELGALARTLNSMLDRLEAGAARQRRFVADAAHELRSPLATLRASIEVARLHPYSYDTAELAGDLEAEVLRMQALVDDLLLLARVGSAPFERGSLDLAAVVRDGAAVTAAATAVDVVVAGSGRAFAGEAAVGRVVRNLVDNAVQHAAAQVRVTVADGLVLVTTTAPGCPRRTTERVFERFVRLDDARERDAGGGALGLAIAREVAREQGGGHRALPGPRWAGCARRCGCRSAEPSRAPPPAPEPGPPAVQCVGPPSYRGLHRPPEVTDARERPDPGRPCARRLARRRAVPGRSGRGAGPRTGRGGRAGRALGRRKKPGHDELGHDEHGGERLPAGRRRWPVGCSPGRLGGPVVDQAIARGEFETCRSPQADPRHRRTARPDWWLKALIERVQISGVRGHPAAQRRRGAR